MFMNILQLRFCDVDNFSIKDNNSSLMEGLLMFHKSQRMQNYATGVSDLLGALAVDHDSFSLSAIIC